MLKIVIQQEKGGKWRATLKGKKFTTKIFTIPYELSGMDCETPENALKWLTCQMTLKDWIR